MYKHRHTNPIAVDNVVNLVQAVKHLQHTLFTRHVFAAGNREEYAKVVITNLGQKHILLCHHGGRDRE